MRWKWAMLAVLALGFPGVLLAQEQTFTPTMEKFTHYILGVSLTKDDGASVEIYSGEYEFNPLAASKGEIIGDIVKRASVSAGTYTGLTVTISKLVVMKMYVDHPTNGQRLMQTTSSGIQKSFQGSGPLDPADYDEFRFIMAGQGNFDPSELEAADPSVTPATAGSLSKSPPAGTITITVEDGKETIVSMKMPDGAPDDGIDDEGNGQFKGGVGNSQFETGQPQ